ncbi:L,D-transpeptidase [Clostridium butyricum]|uniref:L,D-transpeptidase n=1 Tax=Clostridium butyricum TaxID=1492 RepID=UPI00090CBBFE|nr:L,D-transpeptidase [Clostridium butyricum]APF23046.1 L,D-transpeptidase catalytic domain protein [Clostridium butyricum]MBZ0314115.1 L,D-transpeptidase [Clostridium butyricum]
MKKLNGFNINIKMSKKNYKFIYILLSLLAITFLCVFESHRYNVLLSQFKNYFTNYDYDKANNLLLTKEEYNPLKVFRLKNDLTLYFNSEISRLSSDINNKSNTDENILLELNEIKRYDIISLDKIYDLASSIDSLKDSSSNYDNGVKCFSEQDYTDALSYFEKVSSLDLNYTSSLKYMDKARNNIKLNIFEYCDELTENDYYTKAISILDENSSLIKDNIDIQNKISEIKDKQQEYYDKTSSTIEASSQALTSTISPDNINSLNIESSTQYLINVDLTSQKTYIYKGKQDDWTLLKAFSCSTGISGEETPKGSFVIQEKGDWFFSDKYNQGGKYWSQIVGDILFHSVPFDKDKATIVDYTLGEPASHGCIRLSIVDSKWIYDNIPKGSKVIIK